MFEFGLDPAVTTLAIVLIMFVFFVREVFPPEVVALLGLAALLTVGVVTTQQILQVFANPAPWTIAAMFVLSGGLVRTGALNRLTTMVLARAKRDRFGLFAFLAVLIVVGSAVMNNTAIVVLLIPVITAVARNLGLAPSKLLIPLSYAAILGGLCTLIGTSTHLVVDGIARDMGLEPFGLLEITPLGVVLVAWGLLYLRFVGPRLLPVRES
ncbi:MAG: SLC13 family permease, partial [Pseudomonadota bacterium]